MLLTESLVRPVERNARSGKQIAAAVSVILLAVCTLAFVVTNQSSDNSEELLNVPLTNKQRGILKSVRSQKLTLGPGMENADDRAIKVAFATFKDSKDDTVKKTLTFDPKVEEEEVQEAMADMKTITGEVKNEAKILKDLTKPDKKKKK
ncbi:hypothetical protein GUITHDRAFT_161947, partial [Guillardia theta CCMP2712]